MGSGGGGGGGWGESLALEQMKQDKADRDKAAYEVKQAADLAQRRADYSTALTSSKSSALNRANRLVTEAGLDPATFGDLFSRSIEDHAALVPDLDTNPGTYFGDDFVNNILTNYQQGQRMTKARDVQNTFTPGFERSLIADTADDPYITDVLDSQRKNAQLTIDRARARGNLDDTGYAAALTKIGDMYKSGSATAQTLGDSVLQGYRGRLKGIGDDALTNANNFNLGTTFDLGNYTKQRDDLATSLSGQVEGGVRNALTGQNFFDIGSLITQAGTAQGAANPRLSSPGILAQRDQLRDSERGIGAPGTF